jgi:uncharacterized protein (TIGR03118 family)
MRSTLITSYRNWALASCAAGLLLSAAPASAQLKQTNLVSDIPGLAQVTDPNLVNPWGMASSPTSPWWVADNGTGVSTLYNGNTGTPNPLVVTVPTMVGGTPPADPTGLIFNNTAGFLLPGTIANPVPTKALFIFANEDGVIAGWNGAQGTQAVRMADLGDSSFKGLAVGSVASANYLYATDFSNSAIQVFDTNFAPTTLGGSFTDPNAIAGYSPFGIKNLGGKIYVTYALKGGADEVAGPGLGYVDVFDTNGNFIQRVATDGTLDAPWGLAIAPSDFGTFSNDLLVGNFGDGTINAYDPNTYAFLGQLLDQQGNVISIDGLWDLGVGNGGNGGPLNALFFTAGLNDEANGLFGQLRVPEPFTLSLFGAGLAGMAVLRRRRKANKI